VRRLFPAWSKGYRYDVPYPPRHGRILYARKLVAGRNNADFRFFEDVNPFTAKRRKEADFLRAEPNPFFQRQGIFFYILVFFYDMCSRCHGFIDFKGCCVNFLGILVHHHRIRARRQHCTRRNPDRFARADFYFRCFTHPDAAGDFEKCGI